MNRIGKFLVGGAGAALMMGCQGTQPGALYYGFTQIDPVSESVTENAWVVVTGDKISKLGSGTPPVKRYENAKDMSGLYALPGLIDAHAHITAGPHKLDMGETGPMMTMESRDDITEFNARTALAFGITTVRNPGGSTKANYQYDQNVNEGIWIGPEALHAGSILQPLPFGGSAFTHPKTEDEWAAEAQKQADMGMRYFKLYVSLTEDELAQGIKAAHKAGLKAIAHLDSVSWLTAIELGIDGLEHALPTSPDLLEDAARDIFLAEGGQDSTFMYRWFEQVDYDSPKFKTLVAALAENQVELNFNFIVNYVTYNADRPELIDKDWDRYFHPENLEAVKNFRSMSMMGWTPEDFDRARAVYPKVLEFGRILHAAGLPVMIGTDANGGTPFYAMEMDMHVQAGIPKWEVLRLATSSAAETMEIADRTGQIKPGLEADMVFVKANPLEDMNNIAQVELTLSNGQAYRFNDLLADP